jgi:hypothetical protein
LVLFLVLYALTGAILAFNVFSSSDRLAEFYRGRSRLLTPIGGRNPGAWRGGGLVMLASGATMTAGTLLVSFWQLPTISSTAAIAVLLAIAAVCVVMLVRVRSN